MDENVVRRPWISRIPYIRGIEQINIVDNIDPQDSEKTIERMGKGCAHSALKLDFSLSQSMLDSFEHTLDDLVFYYFQAWKV